MDIPPLIAKRLSKSGYPDIEISQAYHITYLEMHAAKEKSGFRYFYYNLDKIKTNAEYFFRVIGCSSPRNWEVDNIVLSDFSELHVRLKIEFNSETDTMIEKAI
ncbi:MAG TPA: hypothetical protein VJ729_13220 [Nitrososphaeraceae archaeon]|nr:hypothetical protein [Nitrososphaeraceae archaeon]